ncbi:MAG: DUF4258 domain-containing protein [Chloroflexia bacterium]|nr:DUF4258 domain-containing protein [Chloroflexia bacterium]
MPAATLPSEAFDSRYFLTTHARDRMRQRPISESAIGATIQCGRVVYRAGAQVYAVGPQGNDCLLLGKDLSKPSGKVITTYRNLDFRGPRQRRQTRGFQQKRTH